MLTRLVEEAETLLKGEARVLQEAAAEPTVERYTLVTDEILSLAEKHKTGVQIPQGYCF